MSFTVSMYHDHEDRVPKESEEIDFKGLHEALGAALKSVDCGEACIGSKCPAKMTNGAWSGVKFKGTRKKENVAEMYVAAYDVDKKTEEELGDIVEKLEASGYSAIIHSTHNDMRDGIRAVRVILELSRPVKPAEWLTLWQGIQDELELHPEQCAFDTCRIFFLPTYPGPQMPSGFIPPHHFEGRPVDVDAMLKSVIVPTATVLEHVQIPVPKVDLPEVGFDIGKLREELGAIRSPKLAQLRKAILAGSPLKPEDGGYTSREPMLAGVAMCVANTESRWTRDELLELVKPSMVATDFTDKDGAGYEERIEKLSAQIDSALVKRDAKDAKDLVQKTEIERLKDSLISMARSGAKLELSQSQSEDLENWELALDFFSGAEKTVYHPTIFNMQMILTFSPDWMGCIRLDEMTDSIRVIDPPRGFDIGTGVRTSALRSWFSTSKWHFEPRGQDVDTATRAIANSNKFNPLKDQIQEYVRAYNDEKELDTWLFRYCGVSRLSADGRDISKYVAAVGRKFLIGMMARLYAPGCKMETVLVLEGKTGARKSTVAKMLSLGYFIDTPQPLGEKDAYSAYRGVWIVEQAELLSIKKAQSETLKAVISSTTDTYRPAYGKDTETFPRGYVFVGTTNETQYLNDPTGARRFWPIACGENINTDGLEAALPTIMAEAFLAFQAGEIWHFTPEEEELAASATKLRYVSSGTENLVCSLYLQQSKPRPEFVTADNFAVWSGLKPGAQYTSFRQEAGRVISADLKWEKIQRSLPGRGQVRGYLVPRDLRDAPASDAVGDWSKSHNKGLM